jgi:hypothetical protein
MDARYTWNTYGQPYWVIYSEMDILKDNNILGPTLNSIHGYSLRTKDTKEWLLRMNESGTIEINPIHTLNWLHGYAITGYIQRLFGLNVFFMHRYQKDRMYIWRGCEYVPYREHHKGGNGKIRRYIYNSVQPSPIEITLLGEVISGATEYTEKPGYKTVW